MCPASAAVSANGFSLMHMATEFYRQLDDFGPQNRRGRKRDNIRFVSQQTLSPIR